MFSFVSGNSLSLPPSHSRSLLCLIPHRNFSVFLDFFPLSLSSTVFLFFFLNSLTLDRKLKVYDIFICMYSVLSQVGESGDTEFKSWSSRG